MSQTTGETSIVEFGMSSGGGMSGMSGVTISEVVQMGVFEHWAFTVDASGNLKAYHNGKLKGEATISTALLPPATNNDSFQFGSLVDWYESGDPRYYWSGKYSNIQIFSSVLSDTEIRNLANEFSDPEVINAYRAKTVTEGSEIQLDIEDAEEIRKYSIYAKN